FRAARSSGLMAIFVLRAATNTIALVVWRKKLKAQRAEPFSTRLFTATIRPVSELVIRSLIQMANSLVAQSRAAQVRSEKNSAALCHWIFTPSKGEARARPRLLR